MGTLLDVDHALAPPTGKRASGIPQELVPLLNHLTTRSWSRPANPPPVQGTLPEDSGKAGGQVERGSSVAQVSQVFRGQPFASIH